MLIMLLYVIYILNKINFLIKYKKIKLKEIKQIDLSSIGKKVHQLQSLHEKIHIHKHTSTKIAKTNGENRQLHNK